MGNYVTVASRPHPNIGYDPCVGSPAGTRALASQIREFSHKIEDLSSFLQGARSDIDYGGWIGDSRRAFQEAMVEFPPKLSQFGGALNSVQGALDSWADELETLQTRSLTLDEELGTARTALQGTNAQVMNWEDTGDNRHEFNVLSLEHQANESAVREAEGAVARLEGEYRDKAEDYGAIINRAGNRSWNRSFWDFVGDIGDWIEDTWVGDVARAVAPLAQWLSDWAGNASAVLTVAGVVALAIPPAWPAVPFLLGGAAITGTAATIGDVALATGGYGDWGTVGLGLVTLGIGKGVGVAGSRIMRIYRNSGRSDQLVRVRNGTGTYEYVPTWFTATEMHDSELVWQLIRYKGTQAEWAITGYGIAQGFRSQDGPAPDVPVDFEASESVDPWNLPPNAAYLQDRDGELVK